VPKLKPTYAAISEKYVMREKRIGDPTQLILVDEADRLKMLSLEQMRAIFDAGGNRPCTDWNAGHLKASGPLPAVLLPYRFRP
jgi:hypothetical protein